MYQKGIEDYQDEIEDLQKENTKLKADLAESERKLRDLCMATGPALIRIHDLEKELEEYRGIAEKMGAEKAVSQLARFREALEYYAKTAISATAVEALKEHA